MVRRRTAALAASSRSRYRKLSWPDDAAKWQGEPQIRRVLSTRDQVRWLGQLRSRNNNYSAQDIRILVQELS
jgi:hypothetical protein